ncbi:MAG: hypothetical protein ACFE8B_14895, partial [Candidatus Hermodarchaeota archaeon]
MSSKSKLITAIVLLAVGGGLIPTGLVTNDYLRDLVSDGVPEAMLGIKDDAIPSLMGQIPVLGTPDILAGVKDEAIPTLLGQIPVLGTPDILAGIKDEAITALEPMLALQATPEVLRGLKTEALAKLPDLIRGATSASIINGTITSALPGFGGSLALTLEYFFNDPVWNATTLGGLSPIEGISEWAGFGNLTYTAFAQNTLMYTGVSMPSIADIPGLLTDLELGLGILTFLEVFTQTGNPLVNASMQGYYNVTWTQLSVMAGYLSTYMFPIIVPGFLGTTPELLAPPFFYNQWANGTSLPGAIDLSLLVDDVPSGTYGAEAGIPIPTNITLPICIDLWNDTIPQTFVNDTGIMTWIAAAMGNTTLQTLLITTFSLSPAQLTILFGWLDNFINTLTPVLVEAETSLTMNQIATSAFYEQWANGTIFGEIVLPNGFLGELDASLAGAPYFEVGLPIASNLSIPECIALWNESGSNTFIDGDSFQNTWLPAMQGDIAAQTAIIVDFGISAGELTILLAWLGAFIGINPITGRAADVLEYEYGQTLTQIATFAFFEQWANGTILGKTILPNGFLGEIDASLAGAPYFEAGLPTASGLSIAECIALWNESGSNTFIDGDGFQNTWLPAMQGDTTAQTAIIGDFGISTGELFALLTWLGAFVGVDPATGRAAQLIEIEYGQTLTEIATTAFYEQWAHGTINGDVILPDGFL